MSKPSVKDRVTEIVRDILSPEMESRGFRHRGRVLWRDGPEVCHVIHIEMNRWGTSGKSSFHVHLGVFWHSVEALLENPSAGKMPPPSHRCTFSIALENANPEERKRPREVTMSSDCIAIGRDVRDDILKTGLPWFEHRSDLSRVLEWKRSRLPLEDGLYTTTEHVNPDRLVVFKMKLGQRDAAIADLRRFAQNGHAEKALTLAKKLKIAKTEIVSVKGRAAPT